MLSTLFEYAYRERRPGEQLNDTEWQEAHQEAEKYRLQAENQESLDWNLLVDNYYKGVLRDLIEAKLNQYEELLYTILDVSDNDHMLELVESLVYEFDLVH